MDPAYRTRRRVAAAPHWPTTGDGGLTVLSVLAIVLAEALILLAISYVWLG